MKKLLVLILILSALLTSCAQNVSESPATVTNQQTAEEKSTAIEKKEPKYEYKVAKPITLEEVNAIPVANSSMSMEELRQLCVDFMNLQLTFPWQPNKSFSYNGMKNTDPVSMTYRTAYGGQPYVSNNQSNLYRVFYYYDQETGVLDIDKMGGNFAGVMGNQCSSNSYWAWARVINSVRYNGTNQMTPAYGCIPIAPCTYDSSISDYGMKGTVTICEENGKQTMFEAYANILPADGIVQSDVGFGHVQMATKAAVVVRNSDGTINGSQSYAMFQDQQPSRTSIMQSNYKPLHIQAGVEHKITFDTLYKGAYIPFTFKEFMGLDPIEKGMASIDLSGNTATKEALLEATITANYAISDAEIIIFDQQGNKKTSLFCFDQNASNLTRSTYSLNQLGITALRLNQYSDGNHTVQVNIRIGNGEIHTVFQGTLIKTERGNS